jgi:hypothetical protein
MIKVLEKNRKRESNFYGLSLDDFKYAKWEKCQKKIEEVY